MSDLAQVLADARGEAQVLRRSGNVGLADYIEALCDRAGDAAADYIRWLSEADAMLKSGLSARTLQRRFRELLDCDLARRDASGRREYRACAIPHRASVTEARERGRGAAA